MQGSRKAFVLFVRQHETMYDAWDWPPCDSKHVQLLLSWAALHRSPQKRLADSQSISDGHMLAEVCADWQS